MCFVHYTLSPGGKLVLHFTSKLQCRIQDYPPTSRIGKPTYYFARKLHKNERNWTERGRVHPLTHFGSTNEIQGGETDHMDPFFNYFTRSSRNVSTARVCTLMWPLLLYLSRCSLLTFLSLLSLLRPRSSCRKYIYFWLVRKWSKTPIATDFDLKFWTTDKITTTW